MRCDADLRKLNRTLRLHGVAAETAGSREHSSKYTCFHLNHSLSVF